MHVLISDHTAIVCVRAREVASIKIPVFHRFERIRGTDREQVQSITVYLCIPHLTLATKSLEVHLCVLHCIVHSARKGLSGPELLAFKIFILGDEGNSSRLLNILTSLSLDLPSLPNSNLELF